ncbi:MAG: septum formation protein Maf [Phycisphaerales bacterium]|nr:septum formation protein Maf [Phycisphaerales bacterium]
MHKDRSAVEILPRLILASASPQRAELLRRHEYDFRVVPSPLPEPEAPQLGSTMTPAALAAELSAFKAKAVATLVREGVILGADTVAAIGDRVFGKPVDRADAHHTLASLGGTSHQVITGLTLLDAATGRCDTRTDTTVVVMRRLSEAELEGYLDTGAWEGKAGAYGIQDHGDAFVERIEGSFTNVVGLPMELLAEMLGAWLAGAGRA